MAETWDPLRDMPAMDGKVVVITGGNSSIGAAMIRLLAIRGAKVYYTTRSEAKSQQVLADLLSKSPDIKLENIEWLPLDYTNLESIAAAAGELNKRESSVDILINNAAASTSATKLVGPGWEPHMAVNFVGPLIFINQVLPLLKNALKQKDADVRIVNISSNAQNAMLSPEYNFEFDSPVVLSKPVTSYPWQWRYFLKYMFGFDMIRFAVSKTATFILSQELQRQLNDSNMPILCIAVHPGEVATNGVMTINPALIRLIARLTFTTPDQGAAAPLFAATATEVIQSRGKYKGRLMVPVGGIENPHPVTKDERQVKALWETATKEANRELVARNLPPLRAW